MKYVKFTNNKYNYKVIGYSKDFERIYLNTI